MGEDPKEEKGEDLGGKGGKDLNQEKRSWGGQGRRSQGWQGLRGRVGAKNLKSSCRMMIEKVMIESCILIERGVAGGTREKLAMLRMQEAKAKSQLGKQRMQKAKARKPPKATKPKNHLPQRNWQCRGCNNKQTEEL